MFNKSFIKELIKKHSEEKKISFVAKSRLLRYLKNSSLNNNERFLIQFIEIFFKYFNNKFSNDDLYLLEKYITHVSYKNGIEIAEESGATFSFLLNKAHNSSLFTDGDLNYYLTILFCTATLYPYGINLERLLRIFKNSFSEKLNFYDFGPVISLFISNENVYYQENIFNELFLSFSDDDWISFINILKKEHHIFLTHFLMSQFTYFYKYDRLPLDMKKEDYELIDTNYDKRAFLNPENLKKAKNMLNNLVLDFIASSGIQRIVERPYLAIYQKYVEFATCYYLIYNAKKEKDLLTWWATEEMTGTLLKGFKKELERKKNYEINKSIDYYDGPIEKETHTNLSSLNPNDIEVPDWMTDLPSSIIVNTDIGPLDYNPNTGHATDSDGNDYLYDSANDCFK